MPNKINLKEHIKETTSFDYITTAIDVDLNNSLFVTHCCANKNPLLTKGKAEDIYIGNRNKIFYNAVKARKVNYCTLSDKYGLIFPNDILETYNVAPTDLTSEELTALKEKVKMQLPKEIKHIIYYSTSPKMAMFYLKMFKDIPIDKKLISKFEVINNYKTKKLF